MTWTIPETGEVLKGTADGRRHPVAGTLALPGRAFALLTLSPRHLVWFLYGTATSWNMRMSGRRLTVKYGST